MKLRKSKKPHEYNIETNYLSIGDDPEFYKMLKWLRNEGKYCYEFYYTHYTIRITNIRVEVEFILKWGG